MKKYLASALILFTFLITVPLVADAQCRGRKNVGRSYVSRNYYPQRYRTASYVYRRPTFYDRHRNAVNIGVSTAGGAIIGGLIGGSRKGMAIGALAGAGGGALYTYVLRKKQRRYF
jgi:hypothetical protein